MGWGNLFAAWFMASTGEKPSNFPATSRKAAGTRWARALGRRTDRGEIVRTLALGLVSIAIIVAGPWPK